MSARSQSIIQVALSNMLLYSFGTFIGFLKGFNYPFLSAVKVQKKTGRQVLAVKPYIIDLESSNGTFLNNQKLDPKR